MIVASIEYPDEKKNKLLFRGKDITFWVKNIFSNLKFYDIGKISTRFEFLILFNLNSFLKIQPEGVNEIFDFVKTQGDPENIVSVEGNPFFVIPKKNFKGLKSGICKKLKKNRDVKNINLKNSFKVLNLYSDLKEIEDFIISFQVRNYIDQGVLIDDYSNFYVEGLIPVGKGTRISTGNVIRGSSEIGKNVVIYPNSYIEDSIIQDNCTILPGCVVRDSKLEQSVQIGPYTHLRNGSVVKKGAKTGNFVEMKKSVLGKGSKSMHLTYIGDSEVGENVNIGAGTITCNYDGVKKHKTVIEDNVFIGSGTELIAPVVIKKNSYVGAGSTIDRDVPEGSLAIARQEQKNIKDWTKKKKKKK